MDADSLNNALPPFVDALGDGVFSIDTGFLRQRFDAAYLIVQGGRAAFVDTGTNHALPRLLAALAAVGLARDAVDWVIPTHVHLDHAGGAGSLMRELPQARLLVHPRGARHMIDPSALYTGALAVYGPAEMARSYGTLVPVDAGRVVPSSDGMRVNLADRELLLLDTPGHASHHHCLWDQRSRGWFTGDTFGISCREFDSARGPWLAPLTPPVQFDPVAMRRSVTRLLAASPAAMYLTHFGRIGDPPARAAQLLALLDRMVAMARAQPPGTDRHQRLRQALLALYLDSLREQGCTLDAGAAEPLLEMDIELNAQGLAIWLDRR